MSTVSFNASALKAEVVKVIKLAEKLQDEAAPFEPAKVKAVATDIEAVLNLVLDFLA